MNNLLLILLSFISLSMQAQETVSFTQRHQVEFVLPEEKGDNFEILNSDETPVEFIINWENKLITIKRTYSSQDYIEQIVEKYVNEDQDRIEILTNYGSKFKLYYKKGLIYMILHIDSIGNKILYQQ